MNTIKEGMHEGRNMEEGIWRKEYGGRNMKEGI
jgi:hypothetical protein